MGHNISIMLGFDPIVGMESTSALSLELVSYLNDYGLIPLNHALNLGGGTSSTSYWLAAGDKKLTGAWKDEWFLYTSSVYQWGIRPIDQKDSLVWAINHMNG